MFVCLVYIFIEYLFSCICEVRCDRCTQGRGPCVVVRGACVVVVVGGG